MPIVSSNAVLPTLFRVTPFDLIQEHFRRGFHDLISENANGGFQGAIASEIGASGIWQLSTGTASTGSSLIRTEFGVPAQQSWAYADMRFRIPTLANTSDRFQTWMGLTSGNNGGFQNGVFCFMDEGSSNRLSTLARSSGTQETAYSGQTPVLSANTWYTLEILLNLNGFYTYTLRSATNSELYKRSSSLNTPALGSGTGLMCWINKTGGTANRTLQLDFLNVQSSRRI